MAEMDERDGIQTILKRINPKLRTKLMPDNAFLLQLVAVGTLTDEEKETINSLKVQSQKIDELLDIMKRRSGGVYYAFMMILMSFDKVLYNFVKTKQDEVFPNPETAVIPLPTTVPASLISANPATSPPAGGSDVMISYNWDSSKPQMLQLKHELVQRGISVWIDVEKMAGNMYDRMTEGVKGAKVVLVCLSQKYELSPNCKMEAQFAVGLEKHVIALKSDGYKSDNWLKLLFGALIYYKVSNEEEMRTSMDNLVKEIQGKISTSEPAPAPPVAPSTPAPQVAPSTRAPGLTGGKRKVSNATATAKQGSTSMEEKANQSPTDKIKKRRHSKAKICGICKSRKDTHKWTITCNKCHTMYHGACAKLIKNRCNTAFKNSWECSKC